MKFLKMLSLAAAALAAFTAFSAGPAYAGETFPNTVLCKANTTTCATKDQFELGTEVEAKLKGVWKLKAGFAVIECEESTFSGKTETIDTPEFKIIAMFVRDCKTGQLVAITATGKIIIHHETNGESTGVATIAGLAMVVESGSTKCTYGGTAVGKGVMINGGNPASAVASETETELVKIEGGILCASPAKLIAGYEIVKPKPLYVATTPI
jgi:hypothetical protein